MNIGEIKEFEINHMPSCWTECNGRELNISDYPELFDAIGNTYGSGSSDTFVLPDLRSFKSDGTEYQSMELMENGQQYKKSYILYTLHATK